MLNLSTCFLLALTAVTTETWPAFLGANASAIDAKTLPLKWSPSENIAWRADLPGHGQSSPVIWSDRVFLTSVEGPKKETYYVICLDLKSGKEHWRKTIANTAPVTNSLYVSRAAPTPLVDEKRVIAQFESGDVVAYSHDGKELWQRNLGKEHGPLVAEFGLGASPCQTESAVFVLLEHDGPSCLVALDKTTGQTQWKADRSARRSWSSPAIVRVAEQPIVVVSSAGSIDGYAAGSGQALFEFKDVGGNTGTTPIDVGNGTFLVGASAGQRGENTQEAKKSNGLMQISQASGKWLLERKWVADDATPSWASPIIHNGLAYWVNRVGVVSCFDAATGEIVYRERTKQSCWATPLPIGDRIYFFGKEGLTTVLAAGRKFEVLSENQLWKPEDLKPETVAEESTEERRRAAAMFSGPTVYGIAAVNHFIVIRIGNQAFCIQAP